MLRAAIIPLIFASAIAAQSRTEVRPPLPPRPGRAIVEFHDGGTRAANATFQQFRRDLASLDRRAAKAALDPIRHEYVHAMFGAAIDVPDELVDALRRLPYVRAVHPDRTVRICVERWVPRPPALATTAATGLAARGEGITVAVLDTGIDYHHEVFGGAFGPGHKIAGGFDFVNDDADPMDDHGHGTHVAGIIAGDSTELTGVAPGATLYAYKVLGGMGGGFESDIVAAIERSMDPDQDGNTSDHHDVVNMSLGGPGHADDPMCLAVDRATAAGVTVVIAAGNEGRLSSIGSPGTARTAITVGAVTDAGVMTSFSSRGPAPALLTFKPDVVAPGYEVLSARMGGGLMRLSGTSMAAPHVAGVAALLTELHPGWTPADIRSALVTTALAMPDPPVARGAGRVDATRAAAATALLDSSGISFGLAPGTTGIWEERRIVTVTNSAPVTRTFQVAATNGPAGTTLTVTPAALELAPGASQAVELKLSLDNAAVAFPDQPALSGIIQFRGDDSFDLPWIVMRSARLTISTDMFMGGITLLSPGGVEHLQPYGIDRAELFGRPGSTYDLLVSAATYSELGPAFRLLSAEDRVVAGDGQLDLPGAVASAELVLDSRDENGRLLRELAIERFHTGRWCTLALDIDKGTRRLIEIHLGSWDRIFVSPMSSSIVLHPFEVSIDMTKERVYNIQYPPIRGITESKTLTADASSYLHTVLNFEAQAPPPHLLASCITNGVKTVEPVLQLHSHFCFTDVFPGRPRVDYYTTRESGNAGSGIMFYYVDKTIVPPLRGLGDSIVATEFTQSPADYAIANGEELTVGTTPLFPIAFYGTTEGLLYQWVWPGFRGAFNDWDTNATQGTAWTTYDAQNAVKASGSIVVTIPPSDPGPAAEPGDRLVAVTENLNVAGLPSRGELEVQFGRDETDLIAPTFTSLRVLDALGHPTSRLRRNTAATLHFSIADHDYRSDAQTQPLKSEATRVWYRPSGTTAWQPLSVANTGSDPGTFTTLGHIPAGDLYRIDLTPATMIAGQIDLRIEAEDAHGNRTTWTQLPAFVVSVSKRRSVR
ncbi:MAG TPA: S8 family serine peptidase [Thermoanaerobaculia bacterium]|nr:S8 family serine peptidase [Thermoanaerobaculia bacterium]